jgi:hypothetical protein
MTKTFGLRRAPLDVLGACLRHELRPNVACRTAVESDFDIWFRLRRICYLIFVICDL